MPTGVGGMMKTLMDEYAEIAVEAKRENAELRERAEKAERQSRCLAENLTESILAHALAPPSKITIDDLWSPDEWLERTKTGVVIL